MKLYNSATRKKEDFKTIEPGKVRMYTCGPTVYNFAHIGNLRSYIMEDALEKYLIWSGLDVKRVMNITDVGHLSSDADTGEDKMLKGARREQKTIMEIARFYTDAFYEDCKKLNISIPKTVVPATSCIDEFIDLISVLLKKDYAYISGGNVYFDTSKLKEYYVFFKHKEDELLVGAREDVDKDTSKRNQSDFVLWFTKSKFDDQELKWDSPWGLGYPGWHIECSAISIKHLGDRLDIHCGGIDNAFPHHTNEIAQSESYIGHKWCNYWFHVVHLNMNNEKMSKSSGEFLTVSLLEEKGYDPLAYRFFCLQSHYRKSLAFTWDALDNSAGAMKKLFSRIASIKNEGVFDEQSYAKYRAEFDAALSNDLNTALAITVLYDVLKANITGSTKLALISEFDRVLSLDLIKKAETIASEVNKHDILDEEIEALIEARQKAREAKDFAEADRMRDKLKDMGILLEDTPQGVKWRKA